MRVRVLHVYTCSQSCEAKKHDDRLRSRDGIFSAMIQLLSGTSADSLDRWWFSDGDSCGGLLQNDAFLATGSDLRLKTKRKLDDQLSKGPRRAAAEMTTLFRNWKPGVSCP